MNILDLDQDEKTGLVYIKSNKKLFSGVGKLYYESGKLENISKGYYENGKRQGKSISYYKNGNLHIEANYTNDKLDGDVKVYKRNGDLDYIAAYIFFYLSIYRLSSIFWCKYYMIFTIPLCMC